MNFHIGIPQAIYLALTFFGTIICAVRHGQPKTGTHDMGSDIFATLTIYALLIWGGFFG